MKNYHHFAVNQGIVHYIKGEYQIALDSLLKHKPYFLKNKDSINLSYIHFYLGKIYQDKGAKELATKYYKKIDSLLNLKLNLTPKFRESYVFLINKFKQEKDFKNQLFYIEKLLEFDSVVNSKTNYLSKTIFKEYDIPKLKQEKKSIIKKMKEDHTLFIKTMILMCSLLFVVILFLVYQFYKRKVYKKKFLDIIHNKQHIKKTDFVSSIENIDIQEEIIAGVLERLKDFEVNNKFLDKKITLNSLAKDFKTNSNYLSKIINHHKETSFSNYINNLTIFINMYKLW
jgi:tetratricopeptide (TPR) repeat protein